MPRAPKTPCFGYRKRKTFSHCCQRHKCNRIVFIGVSRKVSTFQCSGGVLQGVPCNTRSPYDRTDMSDKANVLSSVGLFKGQSCAISCAAPPLLLSALTVLLGALGLFLIGPAFLAAGFNCGRCNQCRRSERHGQKSFAMFHRSPPFLVERTLIVAQARPVW